MEIGSTAVKWHLILHLLYSVADVTVVGQSGFYETLTPRQITDNLEFRVALLSTGMSQELRAGNKRQAVLLAHDITQPMTYVLGIGNPGTSNYVEYASGSDFPGRQKVFMLDGFFALNRKRFAFNAAYTGYKVQRRTAGSFMLSLKYLQGEVLVDPNEGYTAYIGNLTRYGTNQVSLGAGYSLNLVAFHRQPSDGYGKGLRNLTTRRVIPMWRAPGMLSGAMCA